MTHTLSETKLYSLLTEQYFRVYIGPLRGAGMGCSPRLVAEIIYVQEEGGAQPAPSLPKQPRDAGDTGSKESPWPGPAAEAAMEPVSSCLPFPAPGWDSAPSSAASHREQAPRR